MFSSFLRTNSITAGVKQILQWSILTEPYLPPPWSIQIKACWLQTHHHNISILYFVKKNKKEHLHHFHFSPSKHKTSLMCFYHISVLKISIEDALCVVPFCIQFKKFPPPYKKTSNKIRTSWLLLLLFNLRGNLYKKNNKENTSIVNRCMVLQIWVFREFQKKLKKSSGSLYQTARQFIVSKIDNAENSVCFECSPVQAKQRKTVHLAKLPLIQGAT